MSARPPTLRCAACRGLPSTRRYGPGESLPIRGYQALCGIQGQSAALRAPLQGLVHRGWVDSQGGASDFGFWIFDFGLECAPRSPLHAPRFSPLASRPAPRSPLHAPRSPLHAPRSPLHAPRSPLPAPRSAVHAPRFTLPAPRPSLPAARHSPLVTRHSSLITRHSLSAAGRYPAAAARCRPRGTWGAPVSASPRLGCTD